MNYLLAILSALLLVLAFPRFDFPWLIPVALTPLLIAVGREPNPRLRFLLGWITGAGCLAGITDWIRFVITVHGGFGEVSGWAVFAIFCLAKGFYFGVFAMLAGPVLRLSWTVPAVAALWVAVDYTFGAIAFVWITLGNAGADMGIPMRLAPFTGVHGLSFVFMMMSTALASVALRRPRLQLLWLLALPLMILLPPLPEPKGGSASAVLVQPNIDETATWTTESVDEAARRLVLLSMQAVIRGGAAKPDLLIWPEMPAPLYYADDARFRQHAASLTGVTRAPFLFGTVTRASDGSPLNSAILLSPSGERLTRYDKIHLVPFGEYLPWPFGFVGKITKEVGDFQPGAKIVISPLGEHKFGTFICYESAFPGLARQFAQGGAEVLFNLSNDGYFGRSQSAREQHLLVVRMRAAENRRWILRATNDGITAAVDPAGRVLERLPPFRETAGTMQYSYVTERTFYTRYGDWFAYVSLVVAAVAVGRASWPVFVARM